MGLEFKSLFQRDAMVTVGGLETFIAVNHLFFHLYYSLIYGEELGNSSPF